MAAVTIIPSEQAALAALESVPGITWRPFERADLPAIAELYATCEAFDANPERQSLSGLEEFYDSPRSRPDEDTRVAHDDRGEVVATAWAGCNRVVTEKRGVHLGGAVRPDHRGRGLGGAVLRWELAPGLDWDAATRRPGHGPLVVRLHVPTDQHDVRDLAERHGLAVERYYTGMSRSVADPPVVPALDGIRVVGWDPARSHEVHRVVDRAFRDHWGHADRTDEMWEELIGSQDFRPDWTVLAVDDAGDEVVGAALNCAYDQDWEATGVTEGYTDQLGVARSHRGRGVGRALLAESIALFAASGMQRAALDVDSANPTGALRLYELLGYEPTESTCVHQLVRESADRPVSRGT